MIRVSHFNLMSKSAPYVFLLVRVLGPPKKNFGSFRAVLAVALEIGYSQFSKGGSLVTIKKIVKDIGNMGIKSCVLA